MKQGYKKEIELEAVDFVVDDFCRDFDYNIVHATDSKGNKVAVNMWEYANYFSEKLQRKKVSDDEVYIDGIRLDKFVDLLIKKKEKEYNITDFITHETSIKLQREMREKYGVHINWVALYAISMFVREIINRRYAVLFKPTLEDTLNEIGNLENIESISFNLKDGKTHNTDSFALKQLIVDSLKNNKEDVFYYDKIVRKVDVYTKEYGQIEFVRYMSKFFHEYFNSVKRRKNSYLTITEQKIICFLLYYFDFSPELVQESRFRQLINSKYEGIDHFMSLGIKGVYETNVLLYLEFIPYEIWKEKDKINPLDEKVVHKNAFKKNMKINFGEKPNLLEYFMMIEGIIGESSCSKEYFKNHHNV